MDKMTHVKFNLNSFLMAFSVALDNTVDKNKNGIKYNSKRVAYSCLRLINYFDFDPSYFSDIFSYSIVCKNKITKKNLKRIPFNNTSIYYNARINNILTLAKFIEDNIDIKDYLVINKKELINLVLTNKDLNDEVKENFKDLSSDMTYWLDMINEPQLPFYIYNFLQDFTFECDYEVLIDLSRLINEVVYDYRDNKNKVDIDKKCKMMCEVYNFDNKDISRMMISINLYNIGSLFIPKEILLKDSKLSDGEYDLIKSIPYYSAYIISQIFGFDDISKTCSMYAEKLDGSGYPYELEASSLSLKNRLISALIVYQALLENRTYRQGYSSDDAIGILEEASKKGELDIAVVESIISKFKD